MKQCSACKQEKSLVDFHKDASKKDGCTSTCKVCAIARTKQYYGQNKDAVIARANAWVANNRDRHNEKCNAWAKRNKASVNARTARRYASKTQATPSFVTHNPDLLWMIQEAYDLAQLRTKMFSTPWEVDHIIPLRGKKASGLHTPWNLRVIPMSENRRKSNIMVGDLA
jgi:5-methylcytosine-specific restriction endonuclease McrA